MQQEYTVYYIFNILKAAGSYLTADFLNLTDDSNRRKVFMKEIFYRVFIENCVFFQLTSPIPCMW